MPPGRPEEELSRREREIMDAVFSLRTATVSEVVAAMKDPPTRTTVRTLLRILEEKGHLKHTVRGREFVYRPTTGRLSAGRQAIGRVVDTFFSGSLQQAVAAHLSNPKSKLDAEELAAIEEMIRQAKREQK